MQADDDVLLPTAVTDIISGAETAPLETPGKDPQGNGFFYNRSSSVRFSRRTRHSSRQLSHSSMNFERGMDVNSVACNGQTDANPMELLGMNAGITVRLHFLFIIITYIR